jgi:hypothetical protein
MAGCYGPGREGMLARMTLFLDSFWRALAYCLRPRVIALSFLPLLVMGTLSLVLGYFYWDAAVNWVFLRLDSWGFVRNAWGWLEGMGAGNLKTVVAPLVVIVAVMPVVVLLSLLVVAVLMAPALVGIVSSQRFPALERKQGGSPLASAMWSLFSTLLALIALVASVPLWLVPPLVLILPPLIWGWLTYRVMTFDALASHASKAERREIFRRHRVWLLTMGVVTGYLGAAPSIVWASGVLFAAAFVLLIPVAVWIYTLVFALSALWFAHYCLAALAALRAETVATPVALGDVQPPSA